MKLRALLAITIFAATLPALAQPNCGSYLVVGFQCARVAYFGWGVAGYGADSTITLYAPASLTAPASFQITHLNSSQGMAYSGFFGILSSINGSQPRVLTVANAGLVTESPGQGANISITQACFDQACRAPAPVVAGVVANEFSMQFLILSSNPVDLAKIPLPILTFREVLNGVVDFAEQEVAVEQGTLTNTYSVVNLNEAADPANRYSNTGLGFNPITVFSVTNPSMTEALSGALTVLDYNNNIVVTANIQSIPPLGAVGYLLIGGIGNVPALLPPGTVLPSAAGDVVFHGVLRANFGGNAIFLAQEFNGSTMLNLVVEPSQ